MTKQTEERRISHSPFNRLTAKYFICCYSQGHHGQLGIKARIFSSGWIEE